MARRRGAARAGRELRRLRRARALLAFALPFVLSPRIGAGTLAAAPLTLWAGARFGRAREGREFNAALGLAAASLLAYGVALTAAVAWA